jgi:hypothetical protein
MKVTTVAAVTAAHQLQAEITGDRLAEPILHLERFRPEREVLEAMRAAGIEPLAAKGMSEADGEILLTAPADEAVITSWSSSALPPPSRR